MTVLAPTAAEADALSTAFYLLGPEAAAAYLAAHPDVGAIFVDASRRPPAPRLVRSERGRRRPLPVQACRSDSINVNEPVRIETD